MSKELETCYAKVLKSRYISSGIRCSSNWVNWKTLRCFLSFVKERDALSQSDLKYFIYKHRLNGDDITFERERQRDGVNLHNFAGRNVTKEERQIFNFLFWKENLHQMA